MNISSKTVFLVSLVCFSVFSSAFASGFSTSKSFLWSGSQNHFEGVGVKGNVEIFERIGNLFLGKDLSLPLYVVFNSQNKFVSPHLGRGWRLPLFESTIVPNNENSYKVNMPDGRVLFFRQSNQNKDKFIASSVWSIIRKKDSFLVKSIDGIKLTYRKGRLEKMEKDGKRIFFTYEEGRLLQLADDSSVLLKGKINNNKLIFKGKHPNMDYTFTQEEVKEKIRLVQKKSKKEEEEKIKYMERKFNFLANVKIGKQDVLKYTYKQENPLISTLKIHNILRNKERKITWDFQTGIIREDDDYKYTVKFPAKGLYAAISRIGNFYHQKEYWYKDTEKGKEITLRADGVTVERTWFTSGKLRGLTRSITLSLGKKKHCEEYSYGDNGRLMRILVDGKETFFIYDAAGSLVALVTDGKLVKEYSKNALEFAKEYLK
ncbi:hypothetical protein [Akkermansia muciniphila]|uniref:hypothetical protein n=1 Tax=Akkermansia muciniphila TaxID=239935 RepID=UPI001BFEFF87|nr:hypothetical protein [Akkermansia muciniphila]MBT8778147.1 hypothetical protein [Akkermansia muciniphila]